jgi:hypothetical protein
VEEVGEQNRSRRHGTYDDERPAQDREQSAAHRVIAFALCVSDGTNLH